MILFRRAGRLASPLLAGTVLALLPPVAWGGVFVCTPPQGRTLTGDEPPPECRDVPIRELNPDGSIKRVIEPRLTSEQKKKRDLDQQKLDECKRRNQEQKRKDDALVATYMGEDDIEVARNFALAAQQRNIDRLKQRLDELTSDRTRLDTEGEFYIRRQLPEELKRRMDDNASDQDNQRHAIDKIRSEMERINEAFDTDLKRYRELVLRGRTALACEP